MLFINIQKSLSLSFPGGLTLNVGGESRAPRKIGYHINEQNPEIFPTLFET